MFSPPLKKSIVFLKYALKMDLVKGAWFDLYESYVENGSREYVYQIKFKDKSGNEVASTKVVDFYLIDTETLEITDEKTNDWH